MRDWAEYSIAQADGGGASLAFSGRLVVSTVGPIDHELRDLETPLASVDLANLSFVDDPPREAARVLAKEVTEGCGRE